MALSPGQVIGDQFRLERPLGKGGMGEVWVATQLATGRQRALKLMSPELRLDARACERFVEEARIGARIPSDHVVEVVGAGLDGATGVPWMAMELLEGEDLAHVIARRGGLPPAEAAAIFEEIGHGLGAAHEQGIVHRDLKPENVFLAEPRRVGATAEVKLLDFGIATVLGDDRTKATVTSALGTPLWWAPEQMHAGDHVRPSTDVWALGLMAFHALTGHFYWRTPYAEGASVARIVTEILSEPLSPASVRARELGVSALPRGFDDWMAACVVRDPKARFGTARAAVTALLPLLRARAHQGSVAFAATEHHAIPRVAPIAAPAASPSASAPTRAATGGQAVRARRSDPEPVALAHTMPEAGPGATPPPAISRRWLFVAFAVTTVGTAGTAAVVALVASTQRGAPPPPHAALVVEDVAPEPAGSADAGAPIALALVAPSPVLASPAELPAHRSVRAAAPPADPPAAVAEPASAPAPPTITPVDPPPAVTPAPSAASAPAPEPSAASPPPPEPAITPPSHVVLERGGATRLVGNADGGDPFEDACPTGEAVVGLEGNSVPYLGRMRVVCGALVLPADPGRIRVGRTHALASHGRLGPDPSRETCPDDTVAVGFEGRSGLLVDRLALRCAPLTIAEDGTVEVGSASTSGAIGGSGGSPFGTASCSGGAIGRGARIRAGDGIDAFSLTCGVPGAR